MDDLLEKYKNLLAEHEALRKENSELKSLLLAHGISYKPKTEEKTEKKTDVYSPQSFPSVNLSLDEKVALFQALFKGREDVFARRWYSKTTEKGGWM